MGTNALRARVRHRLSRNRRTPFRNPIYNLARLDSTRQSSRRTKHLLGRRTGSLRPNGRTSALRAWFDPWAWFRHLLTKSLYSCQRWHPLICINQALLMELKWIRDYHLLASDERRSATYAKAMAAIKAYPYAIKNAKEALNILGVGDKIAAQCGEYAKSGTIQAAGQLTHRHGRFPD